MNFLREIAVRAKWDGPFTEEWATIRSLISRETDLGNAPGKSDIQKLQAWAKRQGLLMDFDVDNGGFSSQIRTVTFWNAGEAVADDANNFTQVGQASQAGQARAAAAEPEYFDWDAVDCR